MIKGRGFKTQERRKIRSLTKILTSEIFPLKSGERASYRKSIAERAASTSCGFRVLRENSEREREREIEREHEAGCRCSALPVEGRIPGPYSSGDGHEKRRSPAFISYV